MKQTAGASDSLARVLIETLWNVNEDSNVAKLRLNRVLIETLWNVNNSNSSISGRTTEY